MLKLFICDDNLIHLSREITYISSLPCHVEFEVQAFSVPSEFFSRIRSGDVPDIAILDIEMPKVDGISLAEQLNRLCPQCKIIFLTGFTRYSSDAYYADHIWFVLKTDMEKYLPAALDKAISLLKTSQPDLYLLIQQQRTLLRLPLKKILYLERITYRTRVKTLEEEFFVRAAPADLIAHLPADSFIRCHQSYWVNTGKICSQIGSSFVLVDGEDVPISRTYRQSAIESFRKIK